STSTARSYGSPPRTSRSRSHRRSSRRCFPLWTASGRRAVSSSRTEASVLVDVTMPQMGVSVVEGTVVAWRVEVGHRISADETICEISTDKIDTEVPAPVNGVVAEILTPVETTVPVGEVLARIATADGEASAPAPPDAAPPDTPEPDTSAPDT